MANCNRRLRKIADIFASVCAIPCESSDLEPIGQCNPYLRSTLPDRGGLTNTDIAQMTQRERRLRVDLATAYRLCVEDNLNEGICNHLTAAMPGNASFLVIPFGLHWAEATASRLIEVDHSGKVMKGPIGSTAEDTAFLIHGAIHATLGSRALCCMHTHMPYASTLCALATDAREGQPCNDDFPLQLIHQVCGKWKGEIGFEPEYKGLVDRYNTEHPDEGFRLAKSFGQDKRIVFLRNHGVIIIGPSISECFDDLYYLERACRLQVLGMSLSQTLVMADETAADSVRKSWQETRELYSHAHFNSRQRMLGSSPPLVDDLRC